MIPSMSRGDTHRAYSLRSSESGAALGSAAGVAMVRLCKLANSASRGLATARSRASAAALIPLK